MGLVPATLPLRYRKDANLRSLIARLEQWEHSRGNHRFRAWNLDRLRPEIAFEVVQVYVALRERYPQVRPDYVDFSSSANDGVLGWAVSYRDAYPTLRQLISGAVSITEFDSGEQMIEQIAVTDPVLRRQMRREFTVASTTQMRDLTATGYIELGRTFRTRAGYLGLMRQGEIHNTHAVCRGHPPRVPEMTLSPVAATLVHEFGHLVEAELIALGYPPLERTYRDLSELLLGVRPVSDRQWRHHLINFPAYRHTSLPGPVHQSKTQGRETKRVLRKLIAAVIGTYALTSRDELFAEAFTVAYGAHDPQVRNRLAPLLHRLHHEGFIDTTVSVSN